MNTLGINERDYYDLERKYKKTGNVFQRGHFAVATAGGEVSPAGDLLVFVSDGRGVPCLRARVTLDPVAVPKISALPHGGYIFLPPAAPFLSTAKEMGERTPAKTAFLHFLSALCPAQI